MAGPGQEGGAAAWMHLELKDEYITTESLMTVLSFPLACSGSQLRNTSERGEEQ